MGEPLLSIIFPLMSNLNTELRGNRHASERRIAKQRSDGKIIGTGALQAARLDPPMLKVARVVITLYPLEDRADAHNVFFKASIDGLADAKIFANDKGIRELTVRFGGVDKAHPRVVVDVYTMEDAA